MLKKLILLIKILYAQYKKIQTVNFTFGKNVEIIEPSIYTIAQLAMTVL